MYRRAQGPLISGVWYSSPMSEIFKVTATSKPDGKLVPFGPVDQQTGWQLEIPKTLTRLVTYPNLDLDLLLELEFSGERVEISSVLIKGVGGYVSTRALTQLGLPLVIKHIVGSSVPGAERWSKPAKSENLNRPESIEYLAQMYWFEYVGWGTPRVNIMNYMGWKRANANLQIKKIDAVHALPGAHSVARKVSPRKKSRN